MPRSARRSRLDAETVELGHEPPLSVDGGNGGLIDRRRVSAQWFSGTILTGICGAALMGGAVFASLDGETSFAAVPENVEAALRGAIGVGDVATSRRGDRLPSIEDARSARQVIRVTAMDRIGNREVVRVRPYVRVSANLTLSPSELTSDIPPFDAQKLLAAAGTQGAPAEDRPVVEPDAEVSFVTRDLAKVLPQAKVTRTIAIDDVITRVRETANWTGGAETARYQVAAVQPTMRMAYAPTDTAADPYAGFEARIVPENVTLLPKSDGEATGGHDWNERTIAIGKGDTIASILKDVGATEDEIEAIAGALGPYGRKDGLEEGQALRLLVAPTDSEERQKPLRVVITSEVGVEAVAALSDQGHYVAVDVSAMNTDVARPAAEDRSQDIPLYHSLYETALRQQLPEHIIERLLRIYSVDVDMEQKAQPGDALDVLYSGEDDGDASRAEVLYTSLVVGDEVRRFYRFRTPDDGIVDYYDENGRSAKQFLVRKPVASGVMRSGFGSRRHPLLGYTRMHTGVDWAAPLGTPIYAAGNGTVERASWQSGYGRHVRLRHANGYETTYSHMTAFARGMKEGVRVRQGQVIGYIGSTGLSTGPHLHYEMKVNGRFVDPLRVRLPRGRTLDGELLASFREERERIEGLLNRPGQRMAQSPSTTTRR